VHRRVQRNHRSVVYVGYVELSDRIWPRHRGVACCLKERLCNNRCIFSSRSFQIRHDTFISISHQGFSGAQFHWTFFGWFAFFIVTAQLEPGTKPKLAPHAHSRPYTANRVNCDCPKLGPVRLELSPRERTRRNFALGDWVLVARRRPLCCPGRLERREYIYGQIYSAKRRAAGQAQHFIAANNVDTLLKSGHFLQ